MDQKAFSLLLAFSVRLPNDVKASALINNIRRQNDVWRTSQQPPKKWRVPKVSRCKAYEFFFSSRLITRIAISKDERPFSRFIFLFFISSSSSSHYYYYSVKRAKIITMQKTGRKEITIRTISCVAPSVRPQRHLAVGNEDGRDESSPLVIDFRLYADATSLSQTDYMPATFFCFVLFYFNSWIRTAAAAEATTIYLVKRTYTECYHWRHTCERYLTHARCRHRHSLKYTPATTSLDWQKSIKFGEINCNNHDEIASRSFLNTRKSEPNSLDTENGRNISSKFSVHFFTFSSCISNPLKWRKLFHFKFSLFFRLLYFFKKIIIIWTCDREI